jgi:hypothetical protein
LRFWAFRNKQQATSNKQQATGRGSRELKNALKKHKTKNTAEIFLQPPNAKRQKPKKEKSRKQLLISYDTSLSCL